MAEYWGKNKIFCEGKVVTARDNDGWLLTLGLLLIPCTLFIAYPYENFRYLFPAFTVSCLDLLYQGHYWPVIIGGIGITTTFGSFISVGLTDPGTFIDCSYFRSNSKGILQKMPKPPPVLKKKRKKRRQREKNQKKYRVCDSLLGC
jgi:hypothetical protein